MQCIYIHSQVMFASHVINIHSFTPFISIYGRRINHSWRACFSCSEKRSQWILNLKYVRKYLLLKKKMYSQFCQNLERSKLFLQTFSFWPKWSNTILRANTKNQRNINVVQVLKNLIHEYQINVHSYVMKLANITQGYWNTKINYLIFNEMNSYVLLKSTKLLLQILHNILFHLKIDR